MYGYKGFYQSKEKLDKLRRETQGKLSYRDSSKKVISVKYKDKESGIRSSHDVRLSIVETVNAYMPKREDVQIIEYLYSPGVAMRALNRLSGIIADRS